VVARESKSHHVRCPRRGDEGEALGRRAGLLAFASTEVRAGPGAEAVGIVGAMERREKRRAKAVRHRGFPGDHSAQY
jgi:hypothetical protein